MESRTTDAMTDDRRGLLTDREREILRNDGGDVSEKYYGVVVSRVRKKVERVGDDLPALETHDTLADELRAAVCGESTDSIDDPESELRRLSNELGDPITVGDTVYESGDSHPLDASDAPEVDDAHESGGQAGPERRESAESTPASDTAVETPDARERAESTPDTASTIDGDALGLDAERRDAVQAMYEYLREHGTARKSDFTGDVYPEHPAGYGSADGWWNALGTGSTTADSKGALADVAGVEKPPSGRPTWTYTGE